MIIIIVVTSTIIMIISIIVITIIIIVIIISGWGAGVLPGDWLCYVVLCYGIACCIMS